MNKKKIQATTKKIKGKLTAIASTDTPDRVGDSLSVNKWDFSNFNSNPVLQAGHDYRPQFTVGIAKNLRVEDNKVLFEPVFHAITPLAKQIKKMYEEGFLKAWSVGFIPAEAKEEEGQVGEGGGENELLEISSVAVPANAEALMKQMKSIDHSKEKEIAKELEDWVNKQTDEGKEPAEMTADDESESDCEEDTNESAVEEPGDLNIKEQEEIPEHDLHDDIEAEGIDEKADIKTEVRPYPNEHSCRLKSPDDYDKFRRENCAGKHDDKCIDFIYGIKEGDSDIQSMRFPIKEWSEGDAKSYCSDKGGTFEASSKKELNQMKTEETNDHIHLAKFDSESGDGTTDVVNKHAHKIKNFKVQEAEDHTHKLNIKGEKEIDNIKQKEGRVLSKKNRKTIEDAMDALNNVLEMDNKDKSVKEKKVEAWNKTLPEIFHKEFDVRDVEPMTMSFDYDVFTKFLDCKIKNIYVNSFIVSSPLIGTYLNAFKEYTNSDKRDFKLVDIRNWRGDGAEFPPIYEAIQLNFQESESFLIKGTQFFKVEGKNKLGIKFEPCWEGLNVTLVSNSKDSQWTDEFLGNIHEYCKENNLLKGEKFILSGEFLEKGDKTWEDIHLNKKLLDSIKKSKELIQENKTARGMLFVGPPGTGKTLVGKALLNSTDSTFIWVSSRDMDMVGPITALKVAFQLARDLSPTILFIEDIDNWMYLGEGLTTDLMKTEMDGLQESKSILTVLTSNNPERMPKSLIDRPGRFHEIVKFELPNSELRSQMLNSWVEEELDAKTVINIIENTEGFSGAHMKELVDYAKIISDDEDINMSEALDKSLKKLQEQKEFINTIQDNKKEKGVEIDINQDELIDDSVIDEITKVITFSEQKTNQDSSDKQVLLKTLQGISKVSNKALCVSKKKNKK